MERAKGVQRTPLGPNQSTHFTGVSVMTENYTITEEIWLPAVGYEGVYSISNLGRVRRDKPGYRNNTTIVGHILKYWNHHGTYRRVSLKRPGRKKKCHGIHQLVAAAFIGPCPEGKLINHKNGDPADNRPKNLEYVTQLENMRHAHEVLNRIVPTRCRGFYRSLTSKKAAVRGSRHRDARFTEEQVLEIRRVHAETGCTFYGLARKYGVSGNCIKRIIKRVTWTHI
jgi:hypothetical protein